MDFALMKKTLFAVSFATGFIFLFLWGAPYAQAALSCAISASCSAPSIVLFRMSGTSNSHAELPSQANYSNLVCCGGVTGLGNACAGNFAIVAKLSGLTNAHVERNTESLYPQNACVSASAGDTVAVGYAADCSTLGADYVAAASMSGGGITNSHVGNSTAYPNKICVKAVSAAVPPGGGGSEPPLPPLPPLPPRLPLPPPVGPAPLCVDLNGDGVVNLTDFSILLYNWGVPKDARVDCNSDGVVNLIDLSIMLYWWTG